MKILNSCETPVLIQTLAPDHISFRRQRHEDNSDEFLSAYKQAKYVSRKVDLGSHLLIVYLLHFFMPKQLKRVSIGALHTLLYTVEV